MKPPLTGKKFDDYQTPAHALQPLFPYLRKEWVVWECAEGKASLSKTFRSAGYEVVGSDILTGQDFLTWQPAHWDCIVTNPPYSLKQRFLVRAYQLGKPFAFLLPLTTLETRARQMLFEKHGLEIILFDRRINFEVPSQKESKSWFATAWFCYGLKTGRQLTFAHLGKNGQTEMF